MLSDNAAGGTDPGKIREWVVRLGVILSPLVMTKFCFTFGLLASLWELLWLEVFEESRTLWFPVVTAVSACLSFSGPKKQASNCTHAHAKHKHTHRMNQIRSIEHITRNDDKLRALNTKMVHESLQLSEDTVKLFTAFSATKDRQMRVDTDCPARVRCRVLLLSPNIQVLHFCQSLKWKK